MAPCVIDLNTKAGKDAAKALNLASIRKAIPEEAFQKSTFISSQYMIRDYACWFGSMYAIYSLSNSSLWKTMPFWQQALATVMYWNVAGFFMWCMFTIGHDCGHTTFSESELINDVVGLITHGSILMPFHPWQVRSCALLFSSANSIIYSQCHHHHSCLIADTTCITITKTKTIPTPGIPQKDSIAPMKAWLA